MAKEDVKVNEPNVESLMKALQNAKAENEFLRGKLSEAVEQLKFLSVGEVYKRIEVLWRIIDSEGTAEIFGNEFYNKCVEDFKEIMFPPIPEKGDNK